jgi:hypothetical protein
MVSRLDWFNDGIDRMLAEKRPLRPEEWAGGPREGVRARDVDMLRCAAAFNSLRADADTPSPNFVAALRTRVAQVLSDAQQEQE